MTTKMSVNPTGSSTSQTASWQSAVQSSYMRSPAAPYGCAHWTAPSHLRRTCEKRSIPHNVRTDGPNETNGSGNECSAFLAAKLRRGSSDLQHAERPQFLDGGFRCVQMWRSWRPSFPRAGSARTCCPLHRKYGWSLGLTLGHDSTGTLGSRSRRESTCHSVQWPLVSQRNGCLAWLPDGPLIRTSGRRAR